MKELDLVKVAKAEHKFILKTAKRLINHTKKNKVSKDDFKIINEDFERMINSFDRNVMDVYMTAEAILKGTNYKLTSSLEETTQSIIAILALDEVSISEQTILVGLLVKVFLEIDGGESE